MNRYLVFGAGAVGTLLGGLLAHAGHSVVFIGRRPNMEGIRKEGIRISGVWGDYFVPPQPAFETIGEIPESLREFDQIILTIKAFDTEAAIRACLPVLGKNTLVISCQNGYGNCQMIAEHAGWPRTLGARFITGVELPQPGIIQVTVHADDVRLGHYLRQFSLERLETIVEPLRKAGIPSQATEDLEPYIWAKILYNAALNPLGAMLGVTYGDLARNENTRAIMDRIIEEAFDVTSHCGIRQFWSSAGEYREVFYQKMIPPTVAHFPSMLRDLERNRRTEIDVLNGAIVQLGREAGRLTPVNETLVSLMHFRENQEK